jgi:hypothetical protein
LGVLKPAILETDVQLSQLPQSLHEKRLINTKRPFNAGLFVGSLPQWQRAKNVSIDYLLGEDERIAPNKSIVLNRIARSSY